MICYVAIDSNFLKVIGIRPMAPVLNTGPSEGSEHEMLSFSVRKEIIKNDDSLVVISLFKVVENAFLQTLKPIHKVESSYRHYLDMLKLQTNKRNDVYIFSLVLTYESLPASLQSFKRRLQNNFEKSLGEFMEK